MSSHSFPKIDQKEYLKKYLSGDKTKKKKKDKKHKKASKDTVKVKIIDDDLNHLDTDPQIDEELLLTGEDAPQIVGEYIEELPADQKVPKWKSIVIKDESEEDESRPTRSKEEDLWGRKTSDVRIKQEFSTGEKHSNRTPDISPTRKTSTQNRNSNDAVYLKSKIKTEPLSPLHKNPSKKVQNNASSRKKRNSDQSPPRRKQNSSSRDNSPDPNGRNLAVHATEASKKRNSTRFENSQTPDNSPPRRRKNSSRSPKTKRHDNRSPDISPPRRKRNVHQSPTRKGQSSSSDNSPVRRRKSSDQSPPRKYKSSVSEFPSEARHTKHSAQSTSKGRNTEQSSSRRGLEQYSQNRHRRDSDQSPPRRRRHSSDISPPRKSKRTKTPDNSPPRKNRNASDSSPPRRRRNSDQSPPRRKRKSYANERVKLEKRTPDLSPQPARQSRWEKQESERSPSPPPTHKPKPGRTLEGKKAGLQSAQALQKETKERRKNEDLLFETMSSDISGRNAEVKARSTGRKGRRAREAADEDPEERRRKEEYEEKKKQQYDRWGKGLKQIEDHKNRIIQQEYEGSKPLARYADDEDLERHLREQERAEDPMLEYMRQKRKEKDRKSGKPEIPRYEGSYPENRFGIRPGYRWDGVDRSNGYEKKYFAVQNEKQARQDEAYKYSVEDM